MSRIVLSAEETQKLQQKSLQMLLYFDGFCKEHKLTYFLCGGCCIGAIRHGGFIPWDDDIDVFMPRADYERLKTLFKNTPEYSVQFPKKGFNTQNQFLTICANNTTFIKSYQKELDINHGLMLDVIPLDNCPSGIKRKLQKLFALLYSLFIVGKAPTNHGKLITAIGKVLLFIVPRALHYSVWRFCEKQMTKYNNSECAYVSELCSGPYYMRLQYPKEVFEKAVYKEFEGYMLPVPCGFDTYLKMAFGDYMQPPPESERCCHHEFEVIDLDNSYIKYRGINYFKK